MSAAKARELARKKAIEILALPDLVILDTETTGVGEQDEIIQFSAIDALGKVLVDTYICPLHPIYNSKHHGITDETVATAPTFDEVYPQLDAVLRNKHWVIYNADYDVRMLKQNCQLRNFHPIPARSANCVMLLYANFHGEWNDYRRNYRWQKLDTAMACLDLEWQGTAHNALADCRATLAVLRAMAAYQGE